MTELTDKEGTQFVDPRNGRVRVFRDGKWVDEAPRKTPVRTRILLATLSTAMLAGVFVIVLTLSAVVDKLTTMVFGAYGAGSLAVRESVRGRGPGWRRH